MKKKENVQKTKKLNLCISCEMCLAICPESSIKVNFKKGQFTPEIDMNCTFCGKCLLVCPGINPDPFCLRKETIFNEASLDDEYNFINTYVAYSNNLKIRENSTSGGIVTSLINTLIENNEYDSTFVLPFENFTGTPIRLKQISEKKEIIKSSKSKYIPVSAYNIIKTLQKKENKKYIIVGTPCIIQGVINYLKIKNISRDNLLFIGLFCDKTLNYNIIKYFEDSFKEKNEKMSKFEFRTKEKTGWPGNSKIIFNTDREVFINSSFRKELKDYFQLNRCLICLNGKLNPLADISVGDCYSKEEMDYLGKSHVITRTKKGNDLINAYSKIFFIKPVNYIKIIESQELNKKEENWNYFKLFSNRHNLYSDFELDEKSKKELHSLMKKQKHIKWGENYQVFKIRTSIKKNKISKKLRLYSKIIAIGATIGITILNDMISSILPKKSNLNLNKDNIVIIGGGLHNKGAQAMTFTAVNELKKKFPDKKIYLFSELDYKRDEDEKNIYNFEIVPWNPEIKTRLFGLPKKLKLNIPNFISDDDTVKKLKKILENTSIFVDISGYRLSSLGFVTSMDYLIDIMIAKKFLTPYIILPQSIGPFNYPLKYKFILLLIKFYLKYPERIYVREDEGLECLNKLNLKNFVKSQDIVLNRISDYDLNVIYKENVPIKAINIKNNSIGIIPNQRVFDREKREVLYSKYNLLIDTSLKAGKTIYILRHSYDDLEICENIKEMFYKNSNVILIKDDFNAIELELILKQFDFIIASRYHSIIHAYRNNVPALVIGWAIKYKELLESFDQLEYFVDVRNGLDDNKLEIKLKNLLCNYAKEKVKIKGKNKNRENIFEKL